MGWDSLAVAAYFCCFWRILRELGTLARYRLGSSHLAWPSQGPRFVKVRKDLQGDLPVWGLMQMAAFGLRAVLGSCGNRFACVVVFFGGEDLRLRWTRCWSGACGWCCAVGRKGAGRGRKGMALGVCVQDERGVGEALGCERWRLRMVLRSRKGGRKSWRKRMSATHSFIFIRADSSVPKPVPAGATNFGRRWLLPRRERKQRGQVDYLRSDGPLFEMASRYQRLVMTHLVEKKWTIWLL